MTENRVRIFAWTSATRRDPLRHVAVRPDDWFAADHQEWIDAFADADEHTGLRRAILLSNGTEAVILLATEILAAPDECQAWYFPNWIPGAMTFPSFKHLVTWATKPG